MICYKKCLRYGSFFILYLHLKKNILSTQKQKKALSKDDIYNTFLLAHQLNDLVSEIVLYPDLLAVVGLPEIINIFKEITELKSDDPVYLVYDTTFNLGDCNVSPIVFKHSF